MVSQSSSVGYTIMGKTANLTVVQKTTIDTLHKEGKTQKVNTAVYQEVLEHFMLPAADQLYGDADLIFQQDLAPAHSAKATSTWFKDHDIPVLNWPANSPDLNPIENLWGIVKRKMRYARPNNAEELKATIRATWALKTPEQCHRLIDLRLIVNTGSTNFFERERTKQNIGLSWISSINSMKLTLWTDLQKLIKRLEFKSVKCCILICCHCRSCWQNTAQMWLLRICWNRSLGLSWNFRSHLVTPQHNTNM